MGLIKRFFEVMRKEPSPAKFLASRLLWSTRLCTMFVVRRAGYAVRFFPTSVSAACWVYPDYGREDETFFRSYLKPGDTVVDVGANVGTLTLTSAAVVGNTGRVISVEAHPRTYRFLCENVVLNGFRNVVPFNVAVGAAKGRVRFTNKRSDDQNAAVDAGGLEVPLEPLDSLLPGDLERVELLKVDVEGFEKRVFEGAPATLAKTGCIYFESAEEHFLRYGYTTFQLLDFLREQGFKIFRVKDCVIMPIPTEHVSTNVENLLAIRNCVDFQARTGWVVRDWSPTSRLSDNR